MVVAAVRIRQNENGSLRSVDAFSLVYCSRPAAHRRPVRPSAGTVGHFNPGQPYATPSATPYATPDAAEIKRGEDLENREAREAEQNATHANDPANQVKAEQDKIENQIQQEQQKAEGNN